MTAVVTPPRTGPPDTPRPVVRRRRRLRRRTRDMLLGYALVLPSLLIFGTFIFYPFIKNFWLALYRTPPFPGLPRRWVGISQYRDVLTSQVFTNSFKVTLEFVVLTVPIGIVLGLGLAVLAHQRLRGMGIFRVIFSSTVVTSVAVASLISLTLLNPQIGLLNYWLGRTGNLSPLDDPKWALVAVAGVTIWQNLGLSFIIMSAGLQAVPDELLEAARIDGASEFRLYWRIALPLTRAGLTVLGILTFLNAWNDFLWPIIVLQSDTNMTVPVGLARTSAMALRRTRKRLGSAVESAASP